MSFALTGLATLLALTGLAAAAGFADGGFEAGILGGPFPGAPYPLSEGLWSRTSDDSKLVSPPGIVHRGNWALEVDTRNSQIGSAVYQDFDSGTLSYSWTFWLYRTSGTNVAELIYNWDRGVQGRAQVGSWFLLTPKETQFNGWNGNATFPAVPPGEWHELNVVADRCTRTQEVRLDGTIWGTVTAMTPPTSGSATVAFGDVAFRAFQALYNYDDVAFEFFDCSAPAKRPCPLSQGFWKTHPSAWPVSSLVLGGETYSKAELLRLLRTPPRGDASLILAHQLIAAKLNVANGSDPAPISKTISDADALLAPFAGKLPYNVRPSSNQGHTMTALGRVLDDYNNARLTPDCGGCHDEERDRDDDCGADDDRDDGARPREKPPFDPPRPLETGVPSGSGNVRAELRASRHPNAA